jgi:hypothetical protein
MIARQRGHRPGRSHGPDIHHRRVAGRLAGHHARPGSHCLSSRVQLRPIGTSVGRLLTMLAALAGLFAMHGLSDHGMAGPDAVAAAAAPMPMAHVSGANTSSSHEASSTEARPSQQPIQNGHDMGLAGLCLAVLVAALFVGWSLRLRGRRPLRAWLPRWRVDQAVPWPRPLRPPDLLALSIQRC